MRWFVLEIGLRVNGGLLFSACSTGAAHSAGASKVLQQFFLQGATRLNE